MKVHKIVSVIIFLFILSCTKAQSVPDSLESFLNSSSFKESKIQFPKEVKSFYSYFNYRYAWVDKESSVEFKILNSLIDSSTNVGLEKRDYMNRFMVDYRTGAVRLTGKADSIMADIKISDIAIHYFSDVAYGNSKPVLGYNGLGYSPSCKNIPYLLSRHRQQHNMESLVETIQPSSPEYIDFLNKILLYSRRISETDFKEVKISYKKEFDDYNTLLIKLYQLGVIPSKHATLSNEEMRKTIKAVQRLFNLLDDGIIRSTLIEQLNIPLQSRVKELALAVNYMRWLDCAIQNKSTIVLNIPSANLLVHQKGIITLESKVIVGKSSTHTPTLSSIINSVILYPYWQVPNKIAVRELLPIIKRNVGYIDAGNYDVLNKKGRRVNPYDIDWHALGPGNFPYTLRQSTGCDNSLGIVKFDFESPYSVYLHDTPVKGLFDMNKRYFSHGCMRVEKAMELAHLILKNNNIAIDTLTEKGCLLNQAPIAVHADEPMQLFVIYSTAWYYNHEAAFFEDIYHKRSL